MEFGKLENVDHVNFDLPADDPKNFQKETLLNSCPKIFFGCPIWANKLWEGKVYPNGLSPKEYLSYYSQRFNTIELNSTHYHSPDLQMVKRWKESVEQDFHFCPKFPQTISHHKQLRKCHDETLYFVETLFELEEKLGTSFLQLPPHFSLEELTTLEQFLKMIPSSFSLAIEFRHPSWFLNGNLIKPAFDLMTEYKVNPVITDVSGRRDVLHTSLTSKTAQLRFIGNSLHPTDYERIDQWSIRIHDWLNSGLDSIYFFAHQPDNTLAPETASYFLKCFNKIAELEIEDPLRPLPQSQFELF